MLAVRAESVSIDPRARLSSMLVETLELSEDLVMWQRTDAAVAEMGRASDELGATVRRAGHWAAAARAWLFVTTGAAIAMVGLQAEAAFRTGDLSAPMSALLLLMPLALLDIAVPVAEAGALSARTQAASLRLDALERTSPAVTLPQGLHTWIGHGHSEVSGGERARLAVARSLLAAQPVLVLDEPTAHLDHATANELAEEILTGPRSRSVVWITHSTVGLELLDSVLDLDARLPRPAVAAPF